MKDRERKLLLKVTSKDIEEKQEAEEVMFKDYIEPWEQKAINGRGAGRRINMAEVKANKAMETKLSLKYRGLCLLDKNPEGKYGDDPLSDENEWEDRRVVGIVWVPDRKTGFAVATKPLNEDGLEVTYQIGEALFVMARNSKHNEIRMHSVVQAERAAAATHAQDVEAGQHAEDSANGDSEEGEP